MKALDPFGSNIHLLKKVLDLRSYNQSVIASNIANSETPGYHRKEFQFDSELQNAITHPAGSLKTTHQKHIPFSTSNFSDVKGKVID